METVNNNATVTTRPLRSQGISHSFFRWPKNILPQAFEATPHNCVTYQLSALLKRDREDIEADFDKLEGGAWRQEGISTDLLREWCEKHQSSCYVLWGNRLITKDVRCGGSLICVAVYSTHCYICIAAHRRSRRT